ncbi:MAG TPA: hypothetical protein VKZ79_11340 [Alphaproteobacteria bacterium]|nr:hypothetical protein [Alphaproteobacteria bacterium]
MAREIVEMMRRKGADDRRRYARQRMIAASTPMAIRNDMIENAVTASLSVARSSG